MDCDNEGGFIKDMETRRLVSEDASHYILIKGTENMIKQMISYISIMFGFI